MELIEEILKERPFFHSSETEISRGFNPGESFLPHQEAERCASQDVASACYGISRDVAYFISDLIGPSSHTLETGAGISTLIFAIKGATHTVVTPSESEIVAIRGYAKTKNIDLGNIQFVMKPSDQFLPSANIKNLDMVFLDGKHAFPWPVIDWFYSADRLKQGGIMIVDDAHMKSVRILVDFMRVDPGWSLLKSFGNKNFSFRKERDSIHDVAWHMQPYNINYLDKPNKFAGFIRRLISKAT